MSRVGKLLWSLGYSIAQPIADGNEVLPEYKVFFDDIEKEYSTHSNTDLKYILMLTQDRQGYRCLRDENGNLLEAEIKNRFSELLNTHYEKYRTTIKNAQFYKDNEELRGLIQDIGTRGDLIFFHQMHYITQDAIYYSISKLNPEMHKVNKFFIDFFNGLDKTFRHEHQKLFTFAYTLRSPNFRGSLMAYVSSNLDAFERSPFFVMFMVPLKLTPLGEENILEIISLFDEEMQEYENINGITIARDCYKKPKVMNVKKLEKIIHKLTLNAENKFRVERDLPKVGEGHYQEMNLLFKIRAALPKLEIIHQGKPAWLGNQRFDIWIPNIKVAIEYNGKQHYEAVEHWGGEEALIKQHELDERKALLCSENWVRLFIVRYDEDMDAAVLRIRDECR